MIYKKLIKLMKILNKCLNVIFIIKWWNLLNKKKKLLNEYEKLKMK